MSDQPEVIPGKSRNQYLLNSAACDIGVVYQPTLLVEAKCRFEVGVCVEKYLMKYPDPILPRGTVTAHNAVEPMAHPEAHPDQHIFVDSKATWVKIGDDLPQNAEYPPDLDAS
jgi:hypothetical protein